ncbi:MAG: putative Ig domain-containing protein, partial [Thermoguttaceae bacterium]|nr:putative Ig domain-containing protein [Thermoguttaceae bacterium]
MRIAFFITAFNGGTTDENSAPIWQTQEIPNPAFVGSLYEVALEATDPDGDVLTYSFDAERGGTAPVGMTIDAESGKIAWTPTLEQLGEHTFTVVVSDGRGAYATATATLSVVEYERNAAPEFKSEPANYALAEIEYLYRPQIVDANGDAFTTTLCEAPDGMVFDAETNVLRWTPSLDDVGTTVRVALETQDVRGAWSTQIWEIAVCVDRVNEAPTIVSQPSNFVQLGETYAYDVVAVDPENDALIYSLTTAPDGMAIDAATGRIRWTPNRNDLGVSIVGVSVEDATGNRCSQEFWVSTFTVNLAPQITSSAPSGVYAGDEYVYALAAFDPENDPISFRLDEAPEGMTIDSQTGLVRWATTAADVGEYSFGVALSDGFNEYGVRYEIVVLEKPNISVGDAENNPPQILSTPEQYGEVGVRYEYAVVATDPDGDALSYSLETAPQNAVIDPITGVLTWTPNASQMGVSDFIVVVTDARG